MQQNAITEYLDQWWATPMCWFWFVFLFVSQSFAVLDAWQPLWYRRLNVQASYEKLSFDGYLKLLVVNIRSLLVASLFGTLLWSIRFCISGATPQPVEGIATWKMVLQISFCYVCSEGYFWSVHCFVHKHARLNRYVHELHHEYGKPIAMCGLYASISEMFLLNSPLCSLWPVLINMDPTSHSLWNGMVAGYVCFNHCSHQVLPRFIIDANYHPGHHAFPHRQFGSQRLDSLFRTGKTKTTTKS